jgi:hypothetical protein
MMLVLDNDHPSFYDMQTIARGPVIFTSLFLGKS